RRPAPPARRGPQRPQAPRRRAPGPAAPGRRQPRRPARALVPGRGDRQPRRRPPGGAARAEEERKGEMIQITRSLARQLRAVFRKAVPPGSGRGPRPPLMFHADREGLRVRSHHPEVAVEFHLPGTYPVDRIALPPEALDDFEGRKDDAVVL